MPDKNRLDDAQYLREQYRHEDRLLARIRLRERFSTNPQGWFRWVFDHLDLSDGARILDLGCGTGALWRENRQRLPATWYLTLCDLSAGMVQAARRELASASPLLTFCVADAQALPFADRAFDAVIANHMLYHVPDRPRALHEIHRVLRPGGQFYAATNGRGHLREMDEMVGAYVPQARQENLAMGFSLDNGKEQLEAWFSQVTRHDYPDALEITEADPLVAYILSTSARDVLDPEGLKDVREAVAQRIAKAGAFHVTKETGLFSCRKK